MPERLHKDFSASFYSRETSDYSLRATAWFGFGDGVSPLSTPSLAGVRSMSRPMNLTRRNSTSSVSSNSSTLNRMNMNPLTTMANAIPESPTATISAAISSIPVNEDKFRGRAYSEGASSLSSDSSMQTQQQPVASSRYKTELCRPFEENGKCKYGDKCQFAHGKHELRHLARHPKYKTELCRTFHTSGFCPYGPRCHFIHNHGDSNIRSNVARPTVTGISQQPLKPPTHGVPVAVPTPHISERNHFNHRPAQLNLLAKQLSNGATFPSNIGFNAAPASPPYFDLGCSTAMSPNSPTSGHSGSAFIFPNNAVGMMTHQLHNDRAFDMLRSQGLTETTVNDDSAFDLLPTPPDSDRESMTGSPPEKQRLPIFRCLSQS